MPRPDYEKLIIHGKEWLPEPYELACAETDKLYGTAFGKLQNANTTLIENVTRYYLGGIYIDIFPLDGVPNGKIRQKLHFAKYKFYKKMLYFNIRDPYRYGKGIRSIPSLISRATMSREGIQKKLRKIMTKYSFDKCTLVADYDDYSGGMMDKERQLGSPMPIMFEGKEVWTVKDYEYYLTKKYGDYMQVPDVEHQGQHCFHYLDLNSSYKSVPDAAKLLKEAKGKVVEKS